MEHMAAKMMRYLRLYRTLFAYGFMQTSAYRVSFVTEIVVELGWQIVFIVFFVVALGNTHTIAGWSRYQVLFLSGLNIVSSELILSAIYIFGLWRLPAAIKDGDIDLALLKPISPLFNLSLSKPYVTGFLATLPGFGLMTYALMRLGWHFSIDRLTLGIGLFICGFVIAYALSIILVSLCFYFVNASPIPKIAGSITTDFKSNPMDAYQGVARVVLYYVLPVVFISSVPAAAVTRQLSVSLIMLAQPLACGLLWLAVKIWKHMIRRYSSAGS